MDSGGMRFLIDSLTGFTIDVCSRETKTFVIVGVVDPRNKEQVSIYRYVT